MMERFSADRLMAKLPVLWRGLLAILILCGALAAIVESRARILRAGVEIKLRTAPVDPRDLFRGDYVVLNYDISRFDLNGPEGDYDFRRYDTIYIRLGKDAEGFAKVAAAFKTMPETSGGDVVIAARVRSPGSCLDGPSEACKRGRANVSVDYGIERYYVPEGTGRAIENTERNRIDVIAAVAPSGSAAIKRLMIDGKQVHDEPPY